MIQHFYGQFCICLDIKNHYHIKYCVDLLQKLNTFFFVFVNSLEGF
jgi:hypothetical protein